MSVVTTLIENADVILNVLGGIVIIMSLIVAGTKTPDPSTWIGKVYKVIEWLSLNFGKSKDTGKE